MSEDKKFTGFKPEHVGCDVMDSFLFNKGKIVSYNKDNKYPFEVVFHNASHYYSADGKNLNQDKKRRLYFGHNIKVEVTGEEIPEPKLICPVCGVEHDIDKNNHEMLYSFMCGDNCPFNYANFNTANNAKYAMKLLIKAMEAK